MYNHTHTYTFLGWHQRKSENSFGPCQDLIPPRSDEQKLHLNKCMFAKNIKHTLSQVIIDLVK